MQRREWQESSIEISEASLEGGSIVVVADSHSKPHPNALKWVAREKPMAILHAGDIGDHAVLDALEEIAPTHPVRGNIDSRDPRTPDVLLVDVVVSGALSETSPDDEPKEDVTGLRIFLTHIAVYGPRLRKDVATEAHEAEAQLVICGHSHVPLVAHDRDLAVFNPGSLGPRRFHLPITFGVLDLKGGKLGFRHVDCETGAEWVPPQSI